MGLGYGDEETGGASCPQRESEQGYGPGSAAWSGEEPPGGNQGLLSLCDGPENSYSKLSQAGCAVQDRHHVKALSQS